MPAMEDLSDDQLLLWIAEAAHKLLRATDANRAVRSITLRTLVVEYNRRFMDESA